MPKTQESFSGAVEEWLARVRVRPWRADLPAGRELDAEVARAVFGATVCPDGRHLTCSGEPAELCLAPVEPEHYSTHVEAARWVVDRLAALDWSVEVECRRTWLGRERWRVVVGSTVEEDVAAAPAICRAALRALSRSPR